MRGIFYHLIVSCAFFALAGLVGCAKVAPEAATTGQHKHEHLPPHSGTPVVLGAEAYHVELVLDAPDGKIEAYIFDGELENFTRTSTRSFEIVADVKGAPQTLVFNAVANPATGETIGDTSLFEASAEWLKTNNDFDGTLKSITIQGSTFSDVKFNFPKGNDETDPL